MKAGARWPREEYVANDVNFKLIASMLAGEDCFYQADLVHELTQDQPDLKVVCDLFKRSRADLANWEELMSSFMLHDSEIVDLWQVQRDHAANAGTWMHAMLENLLNGYQIMPGPMEGELHAAIRVLGTIGDVQAYRTEWCIHAPEEDLAGSIDLVLRFPDRGEFVLVDWKRSSKLREKYNSYGHFMKSPLDTVPDCQGEHYRLQLNVYKWILEKYYEIKVARMLVVCIHPNYLPLGFIDDVPDMQESVTKLMSIRRDLLLSKALQKSRDTNANQQQQTEEPEPTLPFTVVLPHESPGDPLSDDAAVVLSKLLDNADDEVPHSAKKRRLLPGADSHLQRFSKIFRDSADCIATVLDTYPRDVRNTRHDIRKKTQDSLLQLKVAYPDTSVELQRLILVASYMVDRNLSGKLLLADAATILWMVEGERHLRVHRGFLYIYNDDGSFVPFGGIPPEAVLHRVLVFFTTLEGIFKRMKDNVKRQPDAIAAAIMSDKQNFVDEAAFLDACRHAARCQIKSAQLERLDSGADDRPVFPDQNPDQESWTSNFADNSFKMCCFLRSELMQTRMVSLIVEWCESEDQREPAVCFDDVCFKYDSPDSEHPIEVVKKSAENNCYVHIPHALLDVVLEHNVERLQRFYQQTFWCNCDVFECFQSALALAKRGLNVDRCFIGISPGGVGQSLYSLHLSEMYKQHHCFFDPNVWHLDEELRKQVESFARCFILTGQEAPESSKKLHTDLYKKTMSADGIMGRKPYGYTTRMFHVIGWKRLELNRMMHFAGVSLANFHSLFRRAFIWKGKARFVHPKFLLNYNDHELDGIFAADPSLNKFMLTSQASIAGLRLQWAFERNHTRDDCYQLIEAYCNGGDSYLTEDVMRMACGLTVRQRQLEEGDGIAAVLEGDKASQNDRENKVNEWETLRLFIFETLLSTTTELLTFHEFKKLALKQAKTPNLSKENLWDEMENKCVMRAGIVKHKTSKVKPGAFIPFMTFEKTFREILPEADAGNVRMVFEEEHDMQSLRQYAVTHSSRKKNSLCLLEYHKVMSKTAAGESKKGRPVAEQEAVTRKHSSALQKLQAHEKSIKCLLDGSDASGCARSPGRRLRVKGVLSKQITYHYPDKPAYTVTPRRYAGLGSAQAMSRRLQMHVLETHSADLDIQNCCFSLTYQLLEKMKPEPALPKDLGEVLEELAHRRDDFIQRLQLSRSKGKDVLNAILNGGTPSEDLKENEDVRKLQRISLYLRWVACNILHEDYMSLKDQKGKNFPSATIFSLLWHAVEDRILQCWSEHVLVVDPKPAHLSLHFDGLRISRAWTADIQKFCASSESIIEQQTGFKVKIVEKKPLDFLSAIQRASEEVPALESLPDVCLRRGNCIPCALWHTTPLLRAVIAASLQNSEVAENTEAEDAGFRCYRSASKLYQVDLACSLGLPPKGVSAFLLHFEGAGAPHCVAVDMASDETAITVRDGRRGFRLSRSSFHEAFGSAVDSRTIVCYWPRRCNEDIPAEALLLLDMQAGATSDTSDDEGNTLFSLSPSRIEFDSEDRPFVSDNILHCLETEVKEVSSNLAARAKTNNGRRTCPFCPFRSFSRLSSLRTHITKHHRFERQFIPSGSKQVKVVLALYNHAASSQCRAEALLQESACILRNTVVPPLSASITHIDKHIRLVFDRTGPMYVNVSAVGDSLHVRRARNLYYTHTFADLLLQEMTMTHAQEL